MVAGRLWYISRILTEDAETHRSMERGTNYWRAVESCSSNDKSNDRESRYKKESDIQVAGMLAFYIVTKGKHPFGKEPDRLRNLIDGKAAHMDEVKDPAAKDLISWMLSHDPKNRPLAEKALKHAYLQSEKRQFEMLCRVGNQLEIKIQDIKSDVVRELNKLSPKIWSDQMNGEVLQYLCTDFVNGTKHVYGSSWTECLRFMRNVNEHWHNRPCPTWGPVEESLVGNPQKYFITVFPYLPAEVHRTVRSCNWKERSDLKEYFM